MRAKSVLIKNSNISNVNYNIKINEGDEFGIVNIQIDGKGFIKNRIINDIRLILSKYQGERHLFVDGKEVNPNPGDDGGFV